MKICSDLDLSDFVDKYNVLEDCRVMRYNEYKIGNFMKLIILIVWIILLLLCEIEMSFYIF